MIAIPKALRPVVISAMVGVLASCVANSYQSNDYLVAPGDMVVIDVVDQSELVVDWASVVVVVDEQGNLYIPRVGQVTANGMTRRHLAQYVRTKLKAEDIFTEPAVTISVFKKDPMPATVPQAAKTTASRYDAPTNPSELIEELFEGIEESK